MRLKVKTINLRNEGTPICIINTKTLETLGLSTEDEILIKNSLNDESVFQVVSSGQLIEEGYIGISENLVNGRTDGEEIDFELNPPAHSLSVIKQKIKGGRLNYSDAVSIMDDISSDKLGDIGKTYFASLGYNPGYNEEEIYSLTQAMAQTGDMLKFTGGAVADKHSIGGVAGKGITPIVVSIVASEKLIIPNTTTRAITTPAGTTDVLESIMRVNFNKSEIMDIVNDIGACMVWGGGLSLAPADDKLIRVERYLNFESYDKLLVSIMAKKLAMGIKNLIIDLPVGNHTKVHNHKDTVDIESKFRNLAKKLDINMYIYERHPMGIDGNAVGPLLEAREFLRVLEQKKERSYTLEDDALRLAGKLLELSGKCAVDQGYHRAKASLISFRALAKFKEIIKRQGGDPDINSEGIRLSDKYADYSSTQSGVVKNIDNQVITSICRMLGCPKTKSAGIYFYKNVGDKIEKGEVLFRMYSENIERLESIPLIFKHNLLIIS